MTQALYAHMNNKKKLKKRIKCKELKKKTLYHVFWNTKERKAFFFLSQGGRDLRWGKKLNMH
jgi:hypothetical protein